MLTNVDLNATQAAIRAGYSPDTARDIGCENLTKPNIRSAIYKEMAERSKRRLLVNVSIQEAIEKMLTNANLLNYKEGA